MYGCCTQDGHPWSSLRPHKHRDTNGSQWLIQNWNFFRRKGTADWFWRDSRLREQREMMLDHFVHSHFSEWTPNWKFNVCGGRSHSRLLTFFTWPRYIGSSEFLGWRANGKGKWWASWTLYVSSIPSQSSCTRQNKHGWSSQCCWDECREQKPHKIRSGQGTWVVGWNEWAQTVALEVFCSKDPPYHYSLKEPQLGHCSRE